MVWQDLLIQFRIQMFRLRWVSFLSFRDQSFYDTMHLSVLEIGSSFWSTINCLHSLLKFDLSILYLTLVISFSSQYGYKLYNWLLYFISASFLFAVFSFSRCSILIEPAWWCISYLTCWIWLTSSKWRLSYR